MFSSMSKDAPWPDLAREIRSPLSAKVEETKAEMEHLLSVFQ